MPYGDDDFHHCGRNGNDDIANWGDRWEVQNCELVDLSDLATEASYVRGKLTGVPQRPGLARRGRLPGGRRQAPAGRRPAGDRSTGVTGDPYVFYEVIEGGSGEPTPEEYAGIGDVTEFRYGDVVGNAFRDGNLSNLNNLDGADAARRPATRSRSSTTTTPSATAGHVLTYKNGSSYALAEAFMIACPYGVPQVMSSFTFSNPEAGPPASSNGTTNPVELRQRLGVRAPHGGPRPTWSACATPRPAPAVTNWWSNGGNQIAFGRGGDRRTSPSTATAAR